MLKQYLVWCAVVAAFFYWNTKRLAPKGIHGPHVHHYVIGAFFMTIVCYQSLFTTILHGFLNGLAIDGGARYGFDAIWNVSDGFDNHQEIFERWFHTDTHKHSLG